MIGISTQTAMIPPIKNPMTANKDGNCKLLNPVIACPEVQPPAYRDPKPIKTPETKRIKNPLKDEKASLPKISAGK